MTTREDYVSEIEAIQRKKEGLAETNGAEKEAEEDRSSRVKLGEGGFYDQEIYGGTKSKFAGYVTSIAPNEQVRLCWDCLYTAFLFSNHELHHLCCFIFYFRHFTS